MFSVEPYDLTLASDSGGEHIDPVTTDVLATTGNLQAGRYLVKVTITAHSLDDSKALFVVQHRNDDDEEDPLESAIVAVPVDDSRQFEFGFKVDTDERISVVPYVNITGTVMVAINFQALL